MSKKKIVIFGDSWGYGSELDLTKEKNFGGYLRNETNLQVLNFSKPGYSLPMIVNSIVNNLHILEEETFVIVIIPPDCRWIAPSTTFNGFRSIVYQENYDEEDIPQKYFNEYLLKSDNWFSYHFFLYLMIMQTFLQKTHTKYLLQHNYGNLSIPKNFKKFIDKEKFLDFENSLTSLLTKNKDLVDLLKDKLDGIQDCQNIFTGKYFRNNICHPNTLGHKKIAQIILTSKIFKEWLM